MKTKKELLEEYNTLEGRLNKAEIYFSNLKTYNSDTIENTKEYKAMLDIINKLNELHNIIFITKDYLEEKEKEEEEEGWF